MNTQDMTRAPNPRFIPEAAPFGPAATKIRQADAWWETVTNYLPAPWHPARSNSCHPRKKGKSTPAQVFAPANS